VQSGEWGASLSSGRILVSGLRAARVSKRHEGSVECDQLYFRSQRAKVGFAQSCRASNA